MIDVLLTASSPTGYRRTGPPLGIAYLASALENSGHSVKIIDPDPLGLSEDQLVREIVRLTPAVTGVYCTTMDRYEAFSISSRVKTELPDTLTVLGGPHVTFVDEATLRQIDSIDVIARGEAEETIVDLTKSALSNTDLSRVSGITYRDGDQIQRNPDREPASDLDSIPMPAYHLLPDLGLYAPQGIAGDRKSSIVMTTRGCPYNCSFCNSKSFYGGIRTRRPESVVDEIQFLVDNYDVEFIKFYDDVFTLNKKRTLSICREIAERKLDIGFFVLTRVDAVDQEIVSNLKMAGCEQIQYGLESGCQRVVDGIQKGIDLQTAERAFRITSNVGIGTYVFLMLGLRGETDRDIRDTIDFVIDNSKYIHNMETSINSIYPGSREYYEGLKMGLFDENIWFTYRNDDPLLYRDTPPFPSDVPIERLKAYRRLVHFLKTGMLGSTLSETLMTAGGYLRNHIHKPRDMYLLGCYLDDIVKMRFRGK